MTMLLYGISCSAVDYLIFFAVCRIDVYYISQDECYHSCL